MRAKLAWACTLAFSGIAAAQSPAPPGHKPEMPANCAVCHKPADANLRGFFENAAFKSGSIQLNLGTATEIMRFDPKAIQVLDAGVSKPAEHLREVRKGREARVEYAVTDGVKSVTAISFKGPIKLAPEKLVSFARIDELVALGPEKGAYTLVDSRPPPLFMEATIPSAISLPFGAFDKNLAKLPPDKSNLLVFFCQGVTCMLSPNSLSRAEAMGYTNVKVYREGWPEWTQKRHSVTSAAFVKQAYIDRDIPHILLDARAEGEARRTGFLPGAVEMPAARVKGALATFPEKKLRAPILVYDAGGGEALKVANEIIAAGYEKVVVVDGGLEGWKAAGHVLATGEPATKVAYAPKPRAGSIAVAEFHRIAKERPADALILDVRNREETNEGVIPGSLLVPEEEILARIAEIPADKLIVAICPTGVRAEMAYHKLKDKGYRKVAFLHAEIDVEADGKYEIAVN
jgi:rhodanese-related sulfurtransferase